MAKRIINAELIDSDQIAEIEMEETISFKVLLGKLRTEGHLEDGLCYVKTSDGSLVQENDLVRQYQHNEFILTKNRDWQPFKANDENVENSTYTTGPCIRDADDWYWLLPLLENVSWTDLNLQTQLIELDNIGLQSGKKISLKMVVQYSTWGDGQANRQTALDKVIKMKQIFSDATQVEFASQQINENNLFEKLELLSNRVREYLTMHMEMKWETKVHLASITAFKYQ